MNKELRKLFDKRTLDLKGWRKSKTMPNYAIEGVRIPKLTGTVYKRKGKNGERLSLGVYTLADKLTFFAWGIESEPNCSFYCVSLSDGTISKPGSNCPPVSLVRSKGKPVGIAIRLDRKQFAYRLPLQSSGRTRKQ